MHLREFSGSVDNCLWSQHFGHVILASLHTPCRHVTHDTILAYEIGGARWRCVDDVISCEAPPDPKHNVIVYACAAV